MNDSTRKIPTLSIPLKQARGPFIAGIDVGSTASRGGLYDASGRPLKGSKIRLPHEFTTAADGTSTISPDQVVEECRRVLDFLVAFAEEYGLVISGVAMDSFASSLIAVDGEGRALTRVITYADSRCAPYVEQVAARLDGTSYHQRTGVRLHTSYYPARLLWLRDKHPSTWAMTDGVMSIGEYVYFQLAGIRGMSTSLAAWSGIINCATGELDLETLDALEIDPRLFAPIYNPDEPAYPRTTEWDVLNEIAWFHAIPDGWPSNVGPGAYDASTVAVAAATSGAMRVIIRECPTKLPEGLWCYRVGKDTWILGGALNDVGRAVTWMQDVLAPVEDSVLHHELTRLPASQVPSALPFFSGERATGWAANAKAALWNITDSTSASDIWRAVFESIAYSYRRMWDQMPVDPKRVVASGRVATELPGWLAILADVLGAPVVPVEMKRATLRGTVLIALDVLDPHGARSEAPFGEAFAPRAEASRYYEQLGEQFEKKYRSLIVGD